MERQQALMMLMGGGIAIGASVLPTFVMTIRQIRKAFNPQDDYSIIIGVFWIYIVQFFASVSTLCGFYIFDLFNKGGKYTFMGDGGMIKAFWDLSQSSLTSDLKPEVIATLSSCVMMKDLFIFLNGIMPLLISLIGFFGGLYSSYQASKRDRGNSKLLPLFWGFVGGFIAYMLYYAYAQIAYYSLFIDTSLIEMAQQFWQK